jgi:diguanylate cyclase (GGDEF)-like protein/PAS domain S-box-containing protein
MPVRRTGCTSHCASTDALLENWEFLRALLESIPSMLFVVDSDVRIIHLNSAAARFAGGGSAGDALLRRGGEVLKCLNAGEAQDRCGAGAACRDCVVRTGVRLALERKETHRRSTILRSASQGRETAIPLTVTTSPLSFDGGDYVLVGIEDETELRRAEQAARASEARLRNIASVVGEGLCVTDASGRITLMNREGERLLGWSEGELLGRDVHAALRLRRCGAGAGRGSRCPISTTIRAGTTCRDETCELTRKDGSVFPAAVITTPLEEDGRTVGSVAVFRDITERQKEAEEMQRLNDLLRVQASTDPLTGISNRLRFDEALDVEVKRSTRYDLPLSLIMFDIDQFKAVNDTHGHHAGDAVLCELARLVRRNIRGHDLLARWGGEEFMIMAGNSDADRAAILAEKLRRLVERRVFSPVGRITCSFGVTQLQPGESADQLQRKADAALYRAKMGGRNRVERG